MLTEALLMPFCKPYRITITQYEWILLRRYAPNTQTLNQNSPGTNLKKPYVYPPPPPPPPTMSDNKLVKSILDAATITGLVAGIGWIGKKVIKENLTSDPSASPMNYVKFTAVMAGSIALKKYLEDQKILPTNV